MTYSSPSCEFQLAMLPLRATGRESEGAGEGQITTGRGTQDERVGVDAQGYNLHLSLPSFHCLWDEGEWEKDGARMIITINSSANGSDPGADEEAQNYPLTQVLLPATLHSAGCWLLRKAEYCIRKFTIRFSCLAILFVVPFLISSMSSLSLSTNRSHDIDKSFFVAVSVSCTDTVVQVIVCGVRTWCPYSWQVETLCCARTQRYWNPNSYSPYLRHLGLKMMQSYRVTG